MNKEKVIESLELISKAIKLNIGICGIVSHLLTDNIVVNYKDKLTLLDDNNFNEYIDWKCKLIQQTAKDASQIFAMVNKPYRLTLLQFCKEYLDKIEYNNILSWVWTSTEYPHQESVNKLVELFKLSQKELLMEPDELRKLYTLPEVVTIYRGLQGSKAKIKALSWTLKQSNAEWFANRFGNHGKIYIAKIKRDDIFMYTNSRGEEEVVINPFKLQKLKEVSYDKTEPHHAKNDAN